MKALTLEWLTKAEGDFFSCARECRARKNPNYDSACFHAQQCVEKYLKARLQEAGVPFPKTHHLEDLLKLVLPKEPGWMALEPSILQLVNYAVVFRYPGLCASKADAKKALAACGFVRRTIRKSLGLPVR